MHETFRPGDLPRPCHQHRGQQLQHPRGLSAGQARLPDAGVAKILLLQLPVNTLPRRLTTDPIRNIVF